MNDIFQVLSVFVNSFLNKQMRYRTHFRCKTILTPKMCHLLMKIDLKKVVIKIDNLKKAIYPQKNRNDT